MERTAVNPWSWSVQLGFDQAQLVEGRRRELICSGQDAVDATGNAQHPGDMAAQLAQPRWTEPGRICQPGRRSR